MVEKTDQEGHRPETSFGAMPLPKFLQKNIVGISKRAFLEALGRFGLSVFGYDGEEIASKKENLATWRQSL